MKECEECKNTRDNPNHYNVHSMGCPYCCARTLWKLRRWAKQYPERVSAYKARAEQLIQRLSWYGLDESEVQALSKATDMPVQPEPKPEKSSGRR